MSDSLDLLMRFTLNFLTAFVIIRLIYYRTTRNKDYVFTFFTFNTIIFFVSILLRDIDLSVGFGFGLFAIFSILRYRTDPIPIKEASYLFIIMALPFMNALFVNNEIFMRIIPINVIIIGIVYFIESEIGTSYESKKKVKYEKIELVKPESYPLLLADLEERTGLKITRFEVRGLDFLRDTADLIIYYDSSEVVP